LPSIAPGVGRIAKPVSGTVRIRIPVMLSVSSTVAVSARYTTVSRPPTANARTGIDYVAKSGTVRFAPGQTLAYVTVRVRANPAVVSHDLFVVEFSHLSQATLGGFYGLGVGVIT
jgi:hypothetical protein